MSFVSSKRQLDTDTINDESQPKRIKTDMIEVIQYESGQQDKYTGETYHVPTTIHYCNGLIHRDNDLPAVVNANGTQKWFQYGKIHRDNDKPATIYQEYRNGSVYIRYSYQQNGKLHRENDQPAVFDTDDNYQWFWFGELHRLNDKPATMTKKFNIWAVYGLIHRNNDNPAVEMKDGTLFWYERNKIHRGDDKPAVVFLNGSRMWYMEGKLHRDWQQPAVIDINGAEEWYIDGVFVKNNGLRPYSHYIALSSIIPPNLNLI